MELSVQQTNAARGIAIVMIALYNFLRYPLGIDGNEMMYNPENTQLFLNHIYTGQWLLYLPAYVGWCGMPVFLFLSAYGLSKKYGDGSIDTKAFLWKHAVKLWKLLLVAMVIFWIVAVSLYSPSSIHILHSLCTLTLMSNLVQVAYPGVYWFFGLIMQFYVLFLLLRRCSTRTLWTILVLGLPLTLLMLNAPEVIARYLRYNCIGWLVPFVLGMIFARDRHSYSRWQIALGVLVLIPVTALGFIFRYLGPIVEVTVPLIAVGLSVLFPLPILRRIGMMSSIIFVLHPIVREWMFFNYDCDIYLTLTTIMYVDVLAIITPIWYAVNNCLIRLIRRTKNK